MNLKNFLAIIALTFIFITSIAAPAFAVTTANSDSVTRLKNACKGKTTDECTNLANQANEQSNFTIGTPVYDQNVIDSVNEQRNSEAELDALKAQSANETRIDLYAPFASGKNGATDIFCKRPASPGESSKPGDGGYMYESYKEGACENSGGIRVQRLITARSSEAIINRYFSLIFRYALGLGVGASVLMLVLGGVKMIVSFGNSNSSGDGKKYIQQAAAGIALLVLAATILHIINPNFFVL